MPPPFRAQLWHKRRGPSREGDRTPLTTHMYGRAQPTTPAPVGLSGPGSVALSASQVHPLDRIIRADDPSAGYGSSSSATTAQGGASARSSSTTVSFSAFAFLFSEICNRANQVPTKVKSVEEAEDRLAALGHQVGVRGLPLAALREPQSFRQRPTTMEGALKLIAERLWVRWFGKAAETSKESSSSRYFIVDPEPLLIRHIHPTPDYMDTADGKWFMTHASFVGGMIRGALEDFGFPAKVSSHHAPEQDAPRTTWYVIVFEPHVEERARRLRQ